MNLYQPRILFRTHEGVAFSTLPAGPMRRFAAWLVDQVLVIAFLTVFARIVAPLTALLPDQAFALIILVNFLVTLGYSIILEWIWRGQTIGKRVFRLRVMDENGLPLRFHQVLLRNIVRFVDTLPAFYLVGGLVSAVSRHGQRLGDYVAGTIVVRLTDDTLPDLEEASPLKYNSFRDYPHLCGRLRQYVQTETAFLLLEAVRRRDALLPEARLRLFSETSQYLRGLVSFPEEATMGLTDEQYTRNAVDVLFRPELSGH